jgi:hypothetical protein
MTSMPVESSASYAAEVARLLWPAPWEAPYVTRSRHRSGQPHRDAYIFPNERRPRLLVPADVPRSSTMVRRLGSGRSALAWPLRSLLERSVRSRAFTLARWPLLRVPGTDPAPESIESHLATCLGTPVRVGVILGTRRANQKPVLQVFGLDGSLLGYAKVGHNELTSALVRREAAALESVHDLQPAFFRVPRVIHHGPWAGLEVLVITPLRTSPRRRVPASARLAAMRDVVFLAGTTTAPLATSTFWARCRAEVGLLADRPDSARLAAVADSVEQRWGKVQLTLGGWHGDWGHWNMGMDDGLVQLWDWERYDPAVPAGFDGLHFAAQRVRPEQPEHLRQEQRFLESVPDVLTAFDVPRDQHDLTLRLYLLEIGVRYVEALTHAVTPTLLRRTEWTLALLERLVEQPQPAPTKGHP